MKRVNKWRLICVVCFALAVVGLYLSQTPRIGNALPLRPENPSAVQIHFLSEDTIVAERKVCAEFVKVLRHAKGGGPPCLCPAMGNVVLQYADGSSVKLYVQPG